LYGVFQKYTYPLEVAAGLDLFVGFRYHTSVEVDGYAVFLDDIEVGGPLSDVKSPTGLPDEISLSQNYPNPFNPTTTIIWTVPTSSKVTLKIHNLLGQEVGTLVDGDMSPGEFRTTWDASGYPAAVYFYRLQVGTSVQTRKLVLVK
jgi:Secretion system C-terminal sorting domain